jgi:hypothetical protein
MALERDEFHPHFRPARILLTVAARRRGVELFELEMQHLK